jgi:hypothetical protein
MPKDKEKVNNLKKLPLEDYLKLLPLPPKEHSHELKMEKYVKELLEEQNKR